MTPLSSLEQDLLVIGLDDYVGLWQFVWVLRHTGTPESVDVREQVLESVRRLLEGGYTQPGRLLDDGAFAPWSSAADDSVRRIDREWQALGRDPNIPDICWFSNTAAGDELARSLMREPS